jgi:hypothetical protein
MGDFCCASLSNKITSELIKYEIFSANSSNLVPLVTDPVDSGPFVLSLVSYFFRKAIKY